MRALITGITGQDGRYIIPILHEMNFQVHGLTRRPVSEIDGEILSDLQNTTLHNVDSSNYTQVRSVIDQIQPNYIFNLAGMSSVRHSYESFDETISTNFLSFEKILRSILELGLKDSTRIYQASSSEMFGKTINTPQTERSLFNPISPYGLSKLASHLLCAQYREREGMFISSGILYNHESIKRSEAFVTRKITKKVAEIKLGLADELVLGDLNVRRDWGFAGDYVRAMVAMLLHESPDDFIISTGVSHSVLDFVKESFSAVDMVGAEFRYVKSSPDYVRRQDHANLVGDSSKAHEILNWRPRMAFGELVREMVENDILRLSEKLV